MHPNLGVVRTYSADYLLGGTCVAVPKLATSQLIRRPLTGTWHRDGVCVCVLDDEVIFAKFYIFCESRRFLREFQTGFVFVLKETQ